MSFYWTIILQVVDTSKFREILHFCSLTQSHAAKIPLYQDKKMWLSEFTGHDDLHFVPDGRYATSKSQGMTFCTKNNRDLERIKLKLVDVTLHEIDFERIIAFKDQVRELAILYCVDYLRVEKFLLMPTDFLQLKALETRSNCCVSSSCIHYLCYRQPVSRTLLTLNLDLVPAIKKSSLLLSGSL